jgi:myo-inositol-1(or 4)-monophosphatase
MAAGILLVREAGGEVSDFAGQPDPLFGEHILCSNGRLFQEFQSDIRQIMLSP